VAAFALLTFASGCSDDESTSPGSVCAGLSLSSDKLELRYNGIVVLAAGVNGASVTTSTDGGPTTTITATATRTQTAEGRIITSYSATINGVNCSGP
jgi:hypothetical protein